MFGTTKQKIFALLFIGGLLAAAAAVAFGYGYRAVSQGDTLWSITKELGASPSRWTEIYQANPGLVKYDKNGLAIVVIYPGQQIAIPDTIVPAPAPTEPMPATATTAKPATLVVPEFKGPFWPYLVVAALIGFLLATLNIFFSEQGEKIKRVARRAQEMAKRGLRELTNVFFPTALQPCYAGGIGAWDVAQAMAWDPNGLQLEPVFGEYDVNYRLADGSLWSERRVLNGELGYSPRGSNGQTVVLKGCGNVARRISAQRQTLSERLRRAARRTFRPEPPTPAIDLVRRVPIEHDERCNGKVVVHNNHGWKITPQVLKQDPKGGVFLEPVWQVPNPAREGAILE